MENRAFPVATVAKIVPAMRYLPNVFSALRFPLAALFAVVDGAGARFAVVAAAALTDYVDGPLARRMRVAGGAGQWIDPLADKTFMVTALVTLTIDAGVAWWALPLLLLRDIGIGLGALVLLARGRRAAIPARSLGKWVTWLQFLAIALLLLEPELAVWVAPPVALLGMAALRDYARAHRAATGAAARTGGIGAA